MRCRSVVDEGVPAGGRRPLVDRLAKGTLDHRKAPAVDLAVAYAQRWEIEPSFDELKTRQAVPAPCGAPNRPTLILQEIYGHLCCHYAIRVLMHDTALP